MALNLIQTNAYEVTPVLTLNAQTGTSYTFVLSDSVNTLVTASNASAIAVTIPTNATVAYPVGSVLNFAQTGAGQVTVSGASGVTITSTGATASAPVLRARYSACTIICTASNTFTIVGDLT